MRAACSPAGRAEVHTTSLADACELTVTQKHVVAASWEVRRTAGRTALKRERTVTQRHLQETCGVQSKYTK